jgi:outer membrane protein
MNRIIIALLIVIVCLIGWTFYSTIHTPKIAYVRSGELVYGYQGMKEARQAFESKSKQWQTNLDTLKSDFQKAISDYNLTYAKLSDNEKAMQEKLLRQQEKNIAVYADNIQKQSGEEDTKMTQGILNQVNSFVEQYAKDNGYDLVMGTTESGNVLYGNTSMDITDGLLKAMNEDYKNEPIKK